MIFEITIILNLNLMNFQKPVCISLKDFWHSTKSNLQNLPDEEKYRYS